METSARSAESPEGYLSKDSLYDPATGTYPYFSPSIYRSQLHNPVANRNSNSWTSRLGTMGIHQLQFAANENGRGRDYMYPIYNGSNSGHTYTVHCLRHYGGNCAIEGHTVSIQSGMLPEDAASSSSCNGDCHAGFIENGYEMDFWGMQLPLSGNTVNIQWGGLCPFSGPGYNACGGTASGVAESLGLIRADDWVFAAKNNGELPYAIRASVKCSYGAAPGFGSDGTCSGGVPQGTRGFLEMHDSDVNALSITPIAKALLRTMDEDHYGVVISGSNGGQDGLYLEGENDLTYTALGKPGPWVTDWTPEAHAEGIKFGASNNAYYVSVPFTGLNWSKFKFI